MSEEQKNPIEDPGRIAELVRLGLNGKEGDELLNAYVKEAAEKLGLPASMISVVLDSAQTFCAAYGVEGIVKDSGGIPLEWSWCANSVFTGAPFVANNTATHEKTKGTPLVELENVQCYAGAPLITKNGYVIGNFCVFGNRARTFTDEEVQLLKDYAQQAMDRLEEKATA